MKTTIRRRIVAGLLVLAASSGHVIASSPCSDSTHPDIERTRESWQGTASCTIECKDGKCKTISASCAFAASYEDAKRQLQLSLESRASLEGGKIKGSVNFSISKKFN